MRRYAAALLACLLIILILPSSEVIHSMDAVGGGVMARGSTTSPTRNMSYSLTGVHDIMDVHNTIILGEDFPPPGGKMGFFIEQGPLLVARQYLRDDGTGSPVTYYWGYDLKPGKERYPAEVDLSGELLDSRVIFTYRNGADYDPKPVDSGDIDGDGTTDHIIGDLHDLSGNYFVSLNINGSIRYISGPNKDGFGRWVGLEDLDGDGKDDILIGAPTADSPSGEIDTGAIHVIFGRDGTDFPSTINYPAMVDMSFYGTLGKEKDPQENGHRLGGTFDTGDIDGDGNIELVIGNPLMSFGEDFNTRKLNAGSVEVYDIELLKGWGGRNVTVPYRSDLLSLQGEDPEDSLGYRLMVQDLDLDGIDDLLISSPGGDCLENERKRSGEAYIVYGSRASLKGLEISGPGGDGKEVFAKGGRIDLSIPFIHTGGADRITGCSVRLDPDGEDITFEIGNNEVILSNDTYGTVSVFPEGCSIVSSGIKGTIRASFELDWYVPLSGYTDVLVEMLEGPINSTVRMYPQELNVVKDMYIKGPPALMVNNRELLQTGSRARPGDEVTIYDLELIYRSDTERAVRPDTVDISVVRNDQRLLDRPYTSNWTLVERLIDSDRVEYEFLPSFDSRPPPHGLPARFIPDVGNHSWIPITVDRRRPDQPLDLQVLPDGEVHSVYDDDPVVDLTWKDDLDRSGDGGGSGVREYLLIDDGDKEVKVRERGGLMGTYFADMNFEAEVFHTVDTAFQFDWDHLGPENPEGLGIVQLMPPWHFSIRWHGWFVQPDTGPFGLRVHGEGEVKLVKDGETILDWTYLKPTHEASGDLRMDGGQVADLEIYYRQRQKGGSSSLFIQQMDHTGSWGDLTCEDLYFPTSRITVDTTEHPSPLKVVAVDWVGYRSDAARADPVVDVQGPEFDTSNVPNWVSVNRPSLTLSVRDPAVGHKNGSGIDPATLEYALLEGDGSEMEWKDDMTIMGSDPVTGALEIVCRPNLPDGWVGGIQWRCADVVGNINTSHLIELGVDKEPPQVELLSPSPADDLYGPSHLLSFLATDPRSGVDVSSVLWRYRPELEQWSDWIGTEGEGIISEYRSEIGVSLPMGYVKVQVMASDRMGNSGTSPELELRIDKVPVDLAPVPRISQPVNNSKHPEGWIILMDGSSTSDDGLGLYDELVLTWFSNVSGYLGSGPYLSTALEAGVHRVLLFADDGTEGHNVSTWVEIEVLMMGDGSGPDGIGTEEEGGNNTWMIIVGASALFFAVMLLTIIIVRKERKGPEGGSDPSLMGVFDDDE